MSLEEIRERVENAPRMAAFRADDYQNAAIFEEEDGLETLVDIPGYYSDEAQNAILDMFMNAMEDRRRLLSALEYVLEYGNEYTQADLREMADEALKWKRREQE